MDAFLNIIITIALMFVSIIGLVVAIVGAFLIEKVAVIKGYARYKRYWFWFGLFFQIPALLALIAVPQVVKPDVRNFTNFIEDVHYEGLNSEPKKPNTPPHKKETKPKPEVLPDDLNNFENVTKKPEKPEKDNTISKLEQQIAKLDKQLRDGIISKEEYDNLKMITIKNNIE